MWVPWVLAILPPAIGFLVTVPFHLFLYAFVRRHAERARKGLPSEIICCVSGGSLGVIVTTIFVGFECIVSVHLAMKCVLESWDVENMNNKSGNLVVPPGPDAEAALASDDVLLNPGSLVYPRPTPKYLYLASWILATLAFLSSISPWFTLIADIPIYILTVVTHVPMFISSGSSKRLTTHSGIGGAGVSFLLVILWCIFVLVNILGNILPFQKVLAGLFGVMECMVVGYIAIQHIMESISPSHGRIRLEGG